MEAITFILGLGGMLMAAFAVMVYSAALVLSIFAVSYVVYSFGRCIFEQIEGKYESFGKCLFGPNCDSANGA